MSDAGKIAEQKILEAIANGELENLEGFGKPLDLDEPPGGVPRETWQLMKILKEANVLPEEVELMKRVHDLRTQVAAAPEGTAKVELTDRLRKLELETQLKIEQFNRKWCR